MIAQQIPELSEFGSRLASELDEPPRVVLLGRISSGKSTLLNALLKRDIAPTAHTETTRIVTEFYHGRPERAEFLRGADIIGPTPLSGGKVPETAPSGVDWRTIDRVRVAVTGDLIGVTFVDTPGLGSETAVAEADAESLASGDVATISDRSIEAAKSADVVLVVLDQVERTEDVAALTQLSMVRGSSGGRIGAFAVIGKADQLAAGAKDPIEAAREQAVVLKKRLSQYVSDVFTAAPLLDLNLTMGRIDHHALHALQELDGVPDSVLTANLALASFDEGGTSQSRESRLIAAFGTPDGVIRARQVAMQGLGPLHQWVRDRSGIEALRRELRNHLQRESPILKATRVINQLKARASGPLPTETRGQLHSLLDQLSNSPEAHLLDAMYTLSRLTEATGYPEQLRVDLEAICQGRLELSSIDLRIGDARRIENEAYHPVVRRAAAALVRSLNILAREETI